MEEKDVIRLEFELWAKETGELVDTTKEGLATEKGKADPKANYGPMPMVVGLGRLLKPFEDDILEAKLDEERTLEIPPEDGYGKRDADLVGLFSIHEVLKLPEFKKKDEMPEVGMEIEIRGKKGIITTMTSGRVRVDFNHPLAGKTLVYKYRVVSKADEAADKISWIIEGNYGTSEGFDITVNDDILEILVPDVCKYDENWFVSKFRVVSDLRDVVGIKTIRFIEDYTKKAEKSAEKEASEETSAEEAPAGEDIGEEKADTKTETKADTKTETKAEKKAAPSKKSPSKTKKKDE